MATALPQADIIRRILAKPSLRGELEAHPKRFLQQEFGIRLGPDVEVKVVTTTKTETWAIVPREPGLRGEETGTIAKLLNRYRSEPEFRRRVLNEPKNVYKELTGRVAPDSPTVHVVEETSQLRYIQLPAARPRDMFQQADGEEWGGGGGWDDPPKESQDGSCFDSMHINCCETDIVNPASAWDCCFAEPQAPQG